MKIPNSSTFASVIVILADDNHDAADALVMLLELWGYRAQAAYDGLQAVQLANRMDASLVILDINMPVMNGLEAARTLKDENDGHAPTLFALTANTTSEVQQPAFDAGFDVYLTKPVNTNVLHTLVEQRFNTTRGGPP